jgi:hypothetical protein
MDNALAAIRARIAASENKKSFDNTNFRFWDMTTGSTSEVRFLPDGNPNNAYFWVEKFQIKLPFNGIKGRETKPIYVSVPCVDSWPGEYKGCPILTQIRPWYEEAKRTGDEELKAKANKYWKKASYIMQGFVRVNGLANDDIPVNPIRRFTLNKQLFNLVLAGLKDKEMEHIPCQYEHGTDFRIVKTQKAGGIYADYGTSSYARHESALTAAELAAIEQYSLNDLSEYLGKKPTDKDLQIIEEMFEASVNGEAYDLDKWGSYYRPGGLKQDSESTTTTVAKHIVSSKPSATTPESSSASEGEANTNSDIDNKNTTDEASTTTPVTSKMTSKDIIDMIRKRKTEAAETETETK